MEEAKKQISYCCATLCDKRVVEAALPKISYEEALATLNDMKYYDDDSTHIIEVVDVEDILGMIYGK